MIQMVDLGWQYAQVRERVNGELHRVLASGRYILGEEVRSFERQFAEFHRFYEAEHTLGVASGTDALYIALRALGVGPGHEVITVPNTFVATAHAIERCGARPVFVDVDQINYTMNPELISQEVTERTKAIIPVHLYGHPCDMPRIMAIADRHQLSVVEDCAQATGAHIPYHGARKASLLDFVGTWGAAGCFSFFPTKTLGAAGDGGMILTRQKELFAKMEPLRTQGATVKNRAESLGLNSRLDALQAVILSAKLDLLTKWNARRRELAARYNTWLEQVAGVVVPGESPWAHHVYHLYVIQADHREELRGYLKDRGIETQVHYDQLVTDQPYYKPRYTGPWIQAEWLRDRILSLPLHPGMSDEQVDSVCAWIRAFYLGRP